jgi:class 3 adenylate cyclase
MAKILVVDDETDLEVLITQKFRKKIRANEYEFIFAHDGRDALEKLIEHTDIDIILSDINMPGMDGLALLAHLNEEKPLIKTVMVSAYGDMANIRTAMNKGAFDFITKPINFEDLELTMQKTIDHVLHIKETFQAMKENNILKMYVDESVLRFMASHEFESSIMVNESIEASVVFIDICSFTSISEKESANDVVKLLNEYFDVIVKEIIEHQGYIDKFIGDAVMAVFRGENHLQNAIKACLEVQEQIEQLPVWHHEVDFKPKVSMGVNSGEMVSGNIGSVTLKRLDYTVIGDVVNTSQRLQSAAKPEQIIISEASYQLVKDVFECNEVGSVRLKNKGNEVIIYEVLASKKEKV